MTTDDEIYAADHQVWHGPDDAGPLRLRPGIDPLDILAQEDTPR